jgi:hypothetical protein
VGKFIFSRLDLLNFTHAAMNMLMENMMAKRLQHTSVRLRCDSELNGGQYREQVSHGSFVLVRGTLNK